MLRYVAIIALTLLCSLLPAIAENQELEKVILKVHLKLGETTQAKVIEFTLADLMELPEASVTTSTIWTDGDQTFSGIWVKTLLEHLGVQSGQLEFVAQNEYSIEAPTVDFLQDAALLAYYRNGKVMSLREKGPLWLIYDYDSDAKYRTELYYLRSIWQLSQVVVKEN